MTAAPRLLAGLIPVPVIGMVAKWTMNTAKPIGSGAKTYKRKTPIGTKSYELFEPKLSADEGGREGRCRCYRHMGVTGIALGVSGSEHSVDQDKGADDLSCKSGSFWVTIGQFVGSASIANVEGPLEALDEADTADSAQALSYHVEERTD